MRTSPAFAQEETTDNGKAGFRLEARAVYETPTVSSIVRGGGSVYSNGTSTTYNVTFSESVTGVDASDFSFTTSGSAAAMTAASRV